VEVGEADGVVNGVVIGVESGADEEVQPAIDNASKIIVTKMYLNLITTTLE
jgi:hypothetical protein